jgi:hypothetical protein
VALTAEIWPPAVLAEPAPACPTSEKWLLALFAAFRRRQASDGLLAVSIAAISRPPIIGTFFRN